jgi:hypothetical protein
MCLFFFFFFFFIFNSSCCSRSTSWHQTGERRRRERRHSYSWRLPRKWCQPDSCSTLLGLHCRPVTTNIYNNNNKREGWSWSTRVTIMKVTCWRKIIVVNCNKNSLNCSKSVCVCVCVCVCACVWTLKSLVHSLEHKRVYIKKKCSGHYIDSLC